MWRRGQWPLRAAMSKRAADGKVEPGQRAARPVGKGCALDRCGATPMWTQIALATRQHRSLEDIPSRHLASIRRCRSRCRYRYYILYIANAAWLNSLVVIYLLDDPLSRIELRREHAIQVRKLL